MRLTILASFVLVALSAVTGCSTSTARPVASVDIANDPSWTPPGEMHLSVKDAELAPPKRTAQAHAAPAPNKNKIQNKQLHAAAY